MKANVKTTADPRGVEMGEWTDYTVIKQYFACDPDNLDWIEKKEQEGKTLKLTVKVDHSERYAEYALGEYDHFRASEIGCSDSVDNRTWWDDDYEGVCNFLKEILEEVDQ